MELSDYQNSKAGKKFGIFPIERLRTIRKLSVELYIKELNPKFSQKFQLGSPGSSIPIALFGTLSMWNLQKDMLQQKDFLGLYVLTRKI